MYVCVYIYVESDVESDGITFYLAIMLFRLTNAKIVSINEVPI